MQYSRSSLVDYVVDFGVKNSNSRKNAVYNPSGTVTKITIHHMAGVMDAKRCAEMHYKTSGASANYYIGNDGKICLGVDESRRAQTSSSPANDYLAITIEVSNSSSGGDQPVSNAAFNSLIKLCIDICQRNGIVQLIYTGDKNGNLTRHNMFAATACPGPYLQARFPEIANLVNAGIGTQPTPTPTPVPITTGEKIIQDYLMSKINNPYGVAGLMGNLYAESGLRSNNLQNNYEKSFGMTDEQYTAAVDNGSYNNFVNDSAGYGLAQQTYQSRKQNLYSFAKKYGSSIGDLNMQLDFLCNIELPGYKTVQATLQTAASIREASDIVLTQFERPSDQSENMKQKRASYGQIYYNKYAEGTTPVDPQPEPAKTPYTVRIMVDALNFRNGPSTQYKINGTIYDRGLYTIVKEQNGWGYLKSGAGQICLEYVKKI